MAKAGKSDKTNCMRLIEQAGIDYIPHEYDSEVAVSALDVAKTLNQDPECVFKTLVTVGKSGEHYVFVLPGNSELDLKKAAKASGEKFIEMIPQRELLPLTGYIHGGCSPVGMKKKFKTFINETAQLFETICVSGGKRGLQVEINPLQLANLVQATFVDLESEANQ